MNLRHLLALAAAASFGFAAQAAAPPEPQRLRGTIASADAASLTLHTADGSDVKVLLGTGAKYAAVVASALKAIQPGSFIGAATKGTGAHTTALEVAVFPPALRGQGEGHYGWDKLPDPHGGATATSMTNGTVQPDSPPLVPTSMTNGNINSATKKNGAMHITVSYKGGKSDIVVPPDATVVAFKVAGPDIVKPDAQAFIVAVPSAGGLQAKFVAVGQNGLKPPM